MAMNPMQRKANNAFLLGILITLLITGAIIALLFMKMTKLQSDLDANEANLKNIMVLSNDIQSGAEINANVLTEVRVDSSVIPDNAVGKSGFDLSKKMVAKIDLAKGTIIEPSMIVEDGAQITDDLRKQEYGCIVTPTQIKTGEYIDIRLRLPNGMDFLVVSKKQVTIPQIGSADSESLIHINLTEDEILTMSGAIVEAYMMKGSYLYATTYIEAGMQKELVPTYIPSYEVTTLITKDPNIVKEAKDAIYGRYTSSNTSNLRSDFINHQIGTTEAEERKSLVEQGVQKEGETIKNERAKYLNALATQAPATN